MKVHTAQWPTPGDWKWPPWLPDLVLYFGAPEHFKGQSGPVHDLIAAFPRAVVCGCSTAGEIHGRNAFDNSVVAAFIKFDQVKVRAAAQPLVHATDSLSAGQRIAEQLAAPDLRHVLLLSKGLAVNGTALITGLRENLPEGVAMTGGLAGDGSQFQNTLTGMGRQLQPDQVIAVGFYGASLVTRYGSQGGWEAFGPRRRITRSSGNTLFDVDGQPVLALYKRYLGDRAIGLPATGLLFPLELTSDLAGKDGLVRTILACDEAAQSLTFAGDMPEGSYVRLMKSTIDKLIDGATHAGQLTSRAGAIQGSVLAILVSCVGRRIVFGHRCEEEIEAVLDTLPGGVKAIGFYSYGEACPTEQTQASKIHNQTMTVTLISELP